LQGVIAHRYFRIDAFDGPFSQAGIRRKRQLLQTRNAGGTPITMKAISFGVGRSYRPVPGFLCSFAWFCFSDFQDCHVKQDEQKLFHPIVARQNPQSRKGESEIRMDLDFSPKAVFGGAINAIWLFLIQELAIPV
jgi:hypothetical protein